MLVAGMMESFCLLAAIASAGKTQVPKQQEKTIQAAGEPKMNQLSDGMHILETSRNPDELARAAETLASSTDENELKKLESFLIDRHFLSRLDPSTGQGGEIERFREVLLQLGRNPVPYSTSILVGLSKQDFVREETDRVDVLLEAAAALKPLPSARVILFQAFGDDYFLLKFKLLVDNGSSTALDELEKEILAKPSDVEDDSVVSLMHRAFVPHRTDEYLIRVAEDLAQKNISPALRIGLFESFFDYQSRHWYGPVRKPPEPADLHGASIAALQGLLKLAAIANRSALPIELKDKVHETTNVIRKLLEQRGAAR